MRSTTPERLAVARAMNEAGEYLEFTFLHSAKPIRVRVSPRAPSLEEDVRAIRELLERQQQERDDLAALRYSAFEGYSWPAAAG